LDPTGIGISAKSNSTYIKKKKKIREKVWFGQVANSDGILEEYYA